jgi:hypothetical protein
VFGGNDNSERNDPPISDPSNNEQFETVWKYITDGREILCVYDEMTDEFVLSNNRADTSVGGFLMKIKFD